MMCAIVQARMSSDRLPGKVLHPVRGKPLMQYLLESLSRCGRIDRVIVATSELPDDDAIADLCRRLGVDCTRGPLHDVAERYARVVRSLGLEGFLRVCADSPLLDHRLADQAVALFGEARCDLVSNVLRRTFPKGQSVEVVRSETFLAALPEFSEQDREHVTRHFYGHPERYAIRGFTCPRDLGGMRLCVDTREDLTRFEVIAGQLKNDHWTYDYTDFVELARRGEPAQP